MNQEVIRLTRALTAQEHTDIKAAIKSITAQIAPYTTVVDESQVKNLNKIGDGDKVLIADCLSEGDAAQELLPALFKMETIETSDKLHDQLYEIEDALFELYQHVRRNRMLAGSEASGMVSTFYNIMKTFATGKNKLAAAVAIYKRLQGYYMKRVETAKANKRKAEAQKQVDAVEQVKKETA
ncbi:MAG: hypothetical protein JNL70_06480 [Saprospiraceae bacterium]|nr:hypothetical protein [Saprospiraceae bacterium]